LLQKRKKLYFAVIDRKVQLLVCLLFE